MPAPIGDVLFLVPLKTGHSAPIPNVRFSTLTGHRSFLEQVAVGAGADEHDGTVTAHSIIDAINQQKIAADVAFAIACPLTLDRVVPPRRPERRSRPGASSLP